MASKSNKKGNKPNKNHLDNEDFIPEEDNIVDFVARRVANRTTDAGIQRVGDTIDGAAVNDVTENIQEQRHQAVKPAGYQPIVVGWVVLILGIVGATYAIVKSNPPAPSPKINASSSPVSNQGQDKNSSLAQTDQLCRTRQNDVRAWEALALDATDAIKNTQYREQVSFSQRGCHLIAKVLDGQTIENTEDFQSEIEALVFNNMNSEVQKLIVIEFDFNY